MKAMYSIVNIVMLLVSFSAAFGSIYFALLTRSLMKEAERYRDKWRAVEAAVEVGGNVIFDVTLVDSQSPGGVIRWPQAQMSMSRESPAQPPAPPAAKKNV